MKNIFYFLTFITCITCLAISCSKPTEACFTYTPTSATTNTNVTFNASCSDNASYFSWNFGDNTSDTTNTSMTITHKFSSTGQYIVTLIAERKDGMTLGKDKPKATQTITVQ
jgi:PKD repeat protein